jgi:hypothetical protein
MTIIDTSVSAGIAFTAGGAEPMDTSAQHASAVGPVILARCASHAWLPDALSQTDDLRSLQDNWDSYSARAVDRQTIAHAKRLLGELARIVGIEAPTVTASPDGNASLCWDDGSRSVDLEVLPNGMIEYVILMRRGRGTEPLMDDGRIGDWKLIAELLTRFPPVE